MLLLLLLFYYFFVNLSSGDPQKSSEKFGNLR